MILPRFHDPALHEDPLVPLSLQLHVQRVVQLSQLIQPQNEGKMLAKRFFKYKILINK